MDLNVELLTGDVNSIEKLDFLLIGHKNPLYKQICRETNASFMSVNSESYVFPHQYELLKAPSYKWKQIAAIKFRANGKISDTQFIRISIPIVTALKQEPINSIGIMPPTWRNPEYCALGVIYALWMIGHAAASGGRSYYSGVMNKRFRSPRNVKFTIISQTGIEYFEEVLKNDCDLMWKFIQELCKQRKDYPLFSAYKYWRKYSVNFNVEKKFSLSVN